MGEQIKQIAVVLGAINLDNQKKLLVGMENAAKKFNANLYVFTNYVGTRETEESVMASSRILKLPDFKTFDGIIMVPNTIHNPFALNKIIEELKILDKPVVSLDRKLEGASCVGIDSYAAEFEMVEHFIAHGYRDIVCITGATMVSTEAQKRLQAYKDALEKHGIPFKQENVYDGAFTMESGILAAKKMLEENRIPEAIISCNDDMAHGVIDVFKKAGIRVPEDVKITGFDNGELSHLNRPTLSTVDKNQLGVGYKAVEELLALMDGKEPEDFILPCKQIYRESCGCQSVEDGTIDIFQLAEELKNKYVTQQVDTVFMADVIRGMTTDFAKVRTPEELCDVFKNYVSQMGVDTFYLCMCERDKVFVLPERNFGRNIDVQKVNDDYTPFIDIAVGYENRQFVTYDKFEKGYVLPEECRNKSGGNTYVVNQIFYQNYCYGYAVCERVESVVASGLYYSMMMEIGVALENVRQSMLLKDAVDRLNGMWCYDNLTSLYNRSGFYYEAKNILDNLRSDDKNVFILFMDADGLKTINDNLGHEAGDLLIREIGALVHKNTTNEMLGMRYGGDEFVIFGGFADGEEERIEHLISNINADIERVNDARKYPFLLSVSIGASCWKAREVESLDVVIELADKEMYQEKRRKKMERK
ncbi:MAG: GGDEF domain-containing protein [Agathobacter sp.]|nr:GGDEF domain-containing protein [Agathobacter sp.]